MEQEDGNMHVLQDVNIQRLEASPMPPLRIENFGPKVSKHKQEGSFRQQDASTPNCPKGTSYQYQSLFIPDGLNMPGRMGGICRYATMYYC